MSIDAIKAKVSEVLMQATRSDPPHLVDIAIVNVQGIKVVFTIEPKNENCDIIVEGWDVKFRRMRALKWDEICDATINSRNYEMVTEQTWQRRTLETNLLYNEEQQVRQSVGVFWR